jgi:hypothetical protein
VADQFSIFCCGGCREMGDPRVDPSYSVRNICAINGKLVAYKKILVKVLLDPFAILDLLLNGPTAVSDLPYLKWKFLHGFAK